MDDAEMLLLFDCFLAMQKVLTTCVDTQRLISYKFRKSTRRAVNERRRRYYIYWHHIAGTRFSPRYWTFPRSTDWWENFVTTIWSDEQWLYNFRMTRETFMELVEALRPRLKRQETKMRRPVTVEKRVAVALWYLGSNIEYCKVATQFGVGISTVGEIVIEFCHAVEADIFKKVVRLKDNVGTIMDGFGKLGFPHCIGAIDATHIPIRAPRKRINEFGNRKCFCSIVLQAVCDHAGFFIDADLGFSGRAHDAFVFANSNIRYLMDAGIYVPGNPTINIGGVTVPALIIGDSAYPLRRWLMRPYKTPRTPVHRLFNYRLSRARCVVERAFGRLKARWRRISVRLCVFFENINALICACVTLHNICEEKGHAILDDTHEQSTFILPEQEEELNPQQIVARHRREGGEVRNAIADLLYRNRPR